MVRKVALASLLALAAIFHVALCEWSKRTPEPSVSAVVSIQGVTREYRRNRHEARVTVPRQLILRLPRWAGQYGLYPEGVRNCDRGGHVGDRSALRAPGVRRRPRGLDGDADEPGDAPIPGIPIRGRPSAASRRRAGQGT
jgi:hypothetical protein